MTAYLEVSGYCPICEKKVQFASEYNWLRDHFLCSGCGSIPRERALMKVINDYYPNYRDLIIHESSPGGRGVSVKLHSECSHYSASHYYPDLALGTMHKKHGYQCESLEALTFEDESFDLFITQDVMEHIFDPSKAFSEIARVLKPGGAHVFTVPIINKGAQSECWASLDDKGEIVYHHDPEYHGNPIDSKGSLVTMHWGYDMAEFIQCHANMPTTIVMIDDINMGVRAEYIDVVVSYKL
ncbi:MAG: methyltransferase domain-containing protein [Methylomarinum sp.]|nr:methyltransferase domain-containing protein [Methylomarinum sp.]